IPALLPSACHEHKPSYAVSPRVVSQIARDMIISDNSQATPARLKKGLEDLFLADSRPQVLTELDQLRHELEMACTLAQPPQSEHLFVAFHVHGLPPIFKTIQIVSNQDGNDEARKKMAKQHDANRIAVLIIQARSQAPDWVEALQVFVALDMVHFDLFSFQFLNRYQLFQTDHFWTPPSLPSTNTFALAATEEDAEDGIPLEQSKEKQMNEAKRPASSLMSTLNPSTKKDREASVSTPGAPLTIKLSSRPARSEVSGSQYIEMKDASVVTEGGPLEFSNTNPSGESGRGSGRESYAVPIPDGGGSFTQPLEDPDDDVQVLWHRGGLQADAFKFWILKSAREPKVQTLKEPSIELGNWTYIDWMSTGFDDTTIVGPGVDGLEDNESATIEEMTTDSPAFEHRSPALWIAACHFWGTIHPTITLPQVRTAKDGTRRTSSSPTRCTQHLGPCRSFIEASRT
ncbi:hypothetical protein KCV07_g10148, partial [Aureobasidium melanogenum]